MTADILLLGGAEVVLVEGPAPEDDPSSPLLVLLMMEEAGPVVVSGNNLVRGLVLFRLLGLAVTWVSGGFFVLAGMTYKKSNSLPMLSLNTL